MSDTYTVGQAVTVKRRLWEPPDEDHPGGVLAHPGDRLIVRAVRPAAHFPIRVSHDDRTDGNTFGVTAEEITPREGEQR